MRVGSALRSTEIKPLFPDLWRTQRRIMYVFVYTYYTRFVFANSNHPLGELYRRAHEGCVWLTERTAVFVVLVSLPSKTLSSVCLFTDCLLFMHACMLALLWLLTDCSVEHGTFYRSNCTGA